MAVLITERDLREAMRDQRYWQPGHLERQAYTAWVSAGWQGLYPRDSAPRPRVWVRPYIRDGYPVVGHWRGAPTRRTQGGGGGPGQPPLQNVNWLSLILRYGLRRGPADGRGGTRPPSSGRQPIRDRNRRSPGPDGRDRVQEMRTDPETSFDRILKPISTSGTVRAAKRAARAIWNGYGHGAHQSTMGRA